MTLKDILNTNDRFAACNGIQLTEVREGYARAEMTVGNNHLNAGGVCLPVFLPSYLVECLGGS